MKPEASIKTTRRDWIRASGAAALALSAPGWLLAGQARVAPPIPDALSLLDVNVAKTLVGQQFEMVAASAYVVTELTKVQSLTLRERTVTSFSMEFRPISSRSTLVQDTYQVHHPVLGDFDLLLVPHRNDRGTTVLLATFSRL